MKQQDFKKLALLVGGALLAEYFYKKSTAPVAQTVDNSLLDNLTEGVSNFVGTLTGNKYNDFVVKMTPVSQQIAQSTGIDPLVTMMQSALESNWGTSGLTQKANNLFGYTGDAALNTWLGQNNLAANSDMSVILGMDTSAAPFILMQTHESSPTHAQYFTRPGDIVSQSQNSDGTYDLLVWRPFRRYDSWLASVQDWAHLISTDSRYAQAFKDAKAGDGTAFANDVAAAGYATEPDYAAQLLAAADKISEVQTA